MKVSKNMEIEKILDPDFLNQISFFNFENAITAAFYTDQNLNLVNANSNFENLFKKDIKIKSQNLLTLLANLGVEQEIISNFRSALNTDGKVLIPQIKIMLNGELRYFSLLSTKTKSPFTKILNGIQGQLIDRTAETILKQENEKLISLNQEAYDSLVNAESNAKDGAVLVIPGDPDNSYLIQKMEGAPGIEGDEMPPSSSLEPETIERVRSWIADGARQN